MTTNLYWMQCGACGGDTHSFLNAEAPDVLELISELDLQVLWHPAISTGNSRQHQTLLEKILNDQLTLDILCVEGSIIRGPGGTGMYDVFHGGPKKDLVAKLAHKARLVVAVGTCASFGGIGAKGEIEATGLQFTHAEKGGFLGAGFAAGGGLPVINIAGCPAHPDVLKGTLSVLVNGFDLALDELNQPLEWYGLMVHQGCTRNEYHEYRVEDRKFGEKGCLFFHLGCHGPLVSGACNKVLWNQRSSKTRAGVPCVGCTRPDFPQAYPFFQTRNVEGIPLELPREVSRPHYMAYKSMAAAAAPPRLKKRETNI
jgi:NiFe hydrogenase small subunit HydA